MRKRSLLAIMLSIGCLLATSCVQPMNDSSSDAAAVGGQDTSTEGQQEHKISYSIYQISDGDQTDFDIAINQNPIDAAFVDADTQALQLQYIEAWKTEYYASCQKYTAVLTEAQSVSFDELQLTWEETMLAQFALENEVIKSHHINDSLGKGYHSLYLSAICSAYREQAIHIKYLHYLKESAAKESLSSLEFAYGASAS